MKSVEHVDSKTGEKWTERWYEKGDIVRLKKPDVLGSLVTPAGSWGEVFEVEKDSYSFRISLQGYCNTPNSFVANSRGTRFDVEPWVRLPEDEPAILKNAALTLLGLSRAEVIEAKPMGGHAIPSPASMSITGRLLGWPGIETWTLNPILVEAVLPYVGKGEADPDAHKGPESWKVNAAGYALIAAQNMDVETMKLPGTGNALSATYDRIDEVYRLVDYGTKLTHEFRGEDARTLLLHGNQQVGTLTDGRLPEILHDAMPYPRTLRMDGYKTGLAVIETSDDTLEIRLNEEVLATGVGDDALYLREICAQSRDLVRSLENALGAEGTFAPRMTPRQVGTLWNKGEHHLSESEVTAIRAFANQHGMANEGNRFKIEIFVPVNDPRLHWENGDASIRMSAFSHLPRSRQPLGVAFQVADAGMVKLLPLPYQTGGQFLTALKRSMSHANDAVLPRRTNTFAP